MTLTEAYNEAQNLANKTKEPCAVFETQSSIGKLYFYGLMSDIKAHNESNPVYYWKIISVLRSQA